MPRGALPRALSDAALRRLEAAFSAPEPERGSGGPRVAGVLAPVVALADGSLALLYTRRSDRLASHPGEISFPGGRVDPGDAGPLAAALRETEEEVGLRARDLRVLGHLTDFLTFRDVLVAAYVAALPLELVPPAPASTDEVAEILLLPVDRLGDPRGPPAPSRPRPFYDVVAYEGRHLPGTARGDRTVHYWRLEPPSTLWGITGELTARFLARATGWTPPAPARTIRHVWEYLPEALGPDFSGARPP